MASLERRLEALEDRATTDKGYEIPIEVRVLLKMIGRLQARKEGEEPPPYAQDELAELYCQDQEYAAQCEGLRDEPGWQDAKGQALLDQWEGDARSRLAMIEEGENLVDVYERHDVEDDLKGDG